MKCLLLLNISIFIGPIFGVKKPFTNDATLYLKWESLIKGTKQYD